MWYNSNFFKYSAKILITLLITYLCLLLLPVFYPVINFFWAFFGPIILGVVLYYVVRPFFERLIKLKFSFYPAILIVFLVLFSMIALITTFLIPIVIKQVHEVATSPTEKIEEVKDVATMGILNTFNLNIYSYAEVKNVVTNFIKEIQQYVFKNIYDILYAVTHIAFLFVITPICLFYFLRDDHKFYKWTLEWIPQSIQPQSEKLMEQIDTTLLIFVSGQVRVASIVTFLTLIGLFIIQIDNLFFLTLFTFFLSLIPYFGTLLSIIPPVLVGLTQNYTQAFLAAGVMISIHLVESNLISPQIMMKRFDIHPLTVMLLVFGSFSLFGVTGPLWITPLYVCCREILVQLYDVYEIEKK